MTMRSRSASAFSKRCRPRNDLGRDIVAPPRRHARFRIAGPEARIGRGYDNDVIVDDPYVAAQHLRVFRDEAGQLIAEDMGSVNGTFLDGGKSRQARIVVDGSSRSGSVRPICASARSTMRSSANAWRGRSGGSCRVLGIAALGGVDAWRSTC